MGVLRHEKLEGGVGLITLNKPERMNAWSPDLSEEFFLALNAFDTDLDVRVIVVTGEGRAFCAGADAQGRFDEHPVENEDQRRASVESMTIRRFHDIRKMRTPVIACINGGCVGIGLSLALFCDMRFAAKEAKIGVIFPQRGLIAEDGMAYVLPRLVGTGNALMLLLTGDVIPAEELPKGLVQRTFPRDTVLQETIAFATKLAANSSPTALSVIKRQAFLYPHMSLDEGQAINDRIQAACMLEENPDHQEGFAAFVGKRSPKFGPFDETLPYAKLAGELLHSKL